MVCATEGMRSLLLVHCTVLVCCTVIVEVWLLMHVAVVMIMLVSLWCKVCDVVTVWKTTPGLSPVLKHRVRGFLRSE